MCSGYGGKPESDANKERKRKGDVDPAMINHGRVTPGNRNLGQIN